MGPSPISATRFLVEPSSEQNKNSDSVAEKYHNKMQQNTPLNHFEASLGSHLLRLNLIRPPSNSASSPAQGLGVYIENAKQGYCMEEVFSMETLPKEAETIFFDFLTLFDYIVDNHQDEKRVKVVPQGLLVSNIIKARGAERRQEVVLPINRKPLKESHKPQNKIPQEQLAAINLRIIELTDQNEELYRQYNQLQEQCRHLKETGLSQTEIIKQCQREIAALKEENRSTIATLSKEMVQVKESQKQFATVRQEHLKLLQLVEEIRKDSLEQRQQTFKLRQHLAALNQGNIKLGGQLAFFNGNPLGQKVNISIDKDNKFICMFTFQGNKITRTKADLTRYQLLGNEIMGKVNSTYFEVTINKLTTTNLLIGLASLSRKGQRHSHDSRECVCLEASGKIFEMGKKYPSIAVLKAGQTVRVHFDVESSKVRWLVGFTEIGSVFVPDYLVHSKLVPYLELNEVGDSISLNE